MCVDCFFFFLQKFSHYLLNSNLIERLEARSNGILNALNEFSTKNSSEGGADVGSNADTPTRSFYYLRFIILIFCNVCLFPLLFKKSHFLINFLISYIWNWELDGKIFYQ